VSSSPPSSTVAYARRGAPKLFGAAILLVAMFGTGMWLFILTLQAGRAGGVSAGGVIHDYVSFYSAAVLVKDGRAAEIYDIESLGEVQSGLLGQPLDSEHVLPFFNPPFVAVAFVPLTFLPLGAATGVLFVLNIALVLAGGLSLQRLAGLTAPRQRLVLWLLYVSSYAMLALFLQLQLSMFLLLAWTAFVRFEVTGKSGLSGAALAIGLVKPQIVVLPLAFLCLKRRLDALASIALIAAALTGISVAFAGFAVLWEYPALLLQSASWEANGVHLTEMYGWNGLVAGLTGDAALSSVLAAALSLATLTAVLTAWWRTREVWQRELAPLMALTLLGALLCNLHLYLHDLVLLSVVVALGAGHSLRTTGRFGPWVAISLAFWALLLPIPGMQTAPGFGLPLLTVAMGGVFVYLCSAPTSAPAIHASAPERDSLPRAA
jgi:hypothetical protein